MIDKGGQYARQAADWTESAYADVIAYLESVRETPSAGGLSLGSIGPVSEGLVAWLVGLAAMVGCAVWLGAKSS